MRVGGLLLLAALLVPAWAQTPPAGSRAQASIDSVFPSGGQRGSVVEVSVRGQTLDAPAPVLVSGAGIQVRSVRGISDREVRASLAIAADAEPGPRWLRVAGKYGLSDPARFVVGTLPEAVESEPNEDSSRAEPVSPPVVVNGTFGAGEDVDCFRFRATAGRRCVAAVEACGLDSQVKAGDRWQFTFPVIEIRDAAGRVIAAATEGRSFEPALCFTVPADGEYVAELHDLSYLGGERGVYRFTLGDIPYPISLFPAGGRRGEQVRVRVSGLNLPEPASAGIAPSGRAGEQWVTPFPPGRALPFLTGDLPERMETEPNDARGTRIDIPAVVNGCLARKGDEDRFEVSLRKGEGILVDVVAGRILHSPMDLILSVLDPNGKQLAENDDSPFTLEETRSRADSLSGDPRLEFVAPEDGTYTLRLKDLAGRGGPDCVYRAAVTRLSPGFALSTRYDNPSLPGPGGSGAVFVTLRRWGGFTGAVRLRVLGLPPGFTAGEAVLPGSGDGVTADTTVVSITAPEDAQAGTVAPFRIEGEALIQGERRAVEAEPQAPVGDCYRTIPFFRTTDTCAACVVAGGDLSLRAAVRTARSAPGETVHVPIDIERLGGAPGELSLVALRGHRATFGQPVRVPAGARRFDFPLTIPSSLTPGEYSFVICPPPDGDYRWHRIDCCTPVIRLLVMGEPGQQSAVSSQQSVVSGRWSADSPPQAVTPPRTGGSRGPNAERRTPNAERRTPNAERRTPFSFINDVVPALTRAGCNQGACHGASAGRGGLRLSLLGFDPEADYQAIVRDAGGRRICRTEPGASLLLRKPILQVPHGGGPRLPPGSPAYRVLTRWLALGAPGPVPGEARITALSAAPSGRVMRRGERVNLRVWAAFNDGSRREVTGWARFTTNQPGVAQITAEGTITGAGPGEAVVMVRYQGQVTAATVSVPFAEPPHNIGASSASHAPLSSASFIDAAIERRWRRLGLLPSGPCTDAEFIRRVYLDATGTLPTPEEVRAFLTECKQERSAVSSRQSAQGSETPSPNAERRTPNAARARLVDRLLDRPEWVDYWALYFGDLLRNNREVVGDSPMWAFRAWLKESLRQEKPLPQMLRELVDAPGSLRERPALSYYSTSKTPEELAETTSQVLLGVRLQCAKCHNHPFERWTQDDYYSFAAFFARVKIKGFPNLGKFGGDELVLTASEGEVTHPKTGQPLLPRPLAGRPLESGRERLTQLGDWLASPGNPFVARNIVNRIWARLMGRGLIEPVDDIRVSNPPTHPELLTALVNDFAAHGFRLKHLMRRILTSRAYQLSSRPTRQNVPDDRFYSHYLVRRLGAEQLLDALGAVTGVPERFAGVPAGTRAIALPDNLHGSYFLEVFGRPARVAVCECERDSEPNLTQTLHLLNGSFLQDRIGAENGRVASLLRGGASVPAIVQTLYETAYARPPTARERTTALALIAEAPTPREGLEDLLWTLLNSREFLLNH